MKKILNFAISGSGVVVENCPVGLALKNHVPTVLKGITHGLIFTLMLTFACFLAIVFIQIAIDLNPFDDLSEEGSSDWQDVSDWEDLNEEDEQIMAEHIKNLEAKEHEVITEEFIKAANSNANDDISNAEVLEVNTSSTLEAQITLEDDLIKQDPKIIDIIEEHFKNNTEVGSFDEIDDIDNVTMTEQGDSEEMSFVFVYNTPDYSK